MPPDDSETATDWFLSFPATTPRQPYRPDSPAATAESWRGQTGELEARGALTVGSASGVPAAAKDF